MANITKRTNKAGEASFLIRVFLHEGVNGKQVTKSMTWKPPAGMKPGAAEKQAQKEAVLFEEKVRKGVVTIDGSMKFADYAARWLENSELKPTTRRANTHNLNLINQAIGHIPLEKLRPEHLQEFYKNLREGGLKHQGRVCSPTLKKKLEEANITQKDLSALAGVRVELIGRAANGGYVMAEKAAQISAYLASVGVNTRGLFIPDDRAQTMATSTIRGIHGLISAILKSAKKSRILPHCITEFMTPPKIEDKEAKYLDDVQAREYLIALLNEPDIRIRTAMIILLFTGMRRGELCGLEWRDIDYFDCQIHIRRASYYTPDTGIYESTPKTRGSIRSISVTPFLFEVIRQYEEWQNEKAAELGDLWQNEKGRLFTSDDGNPLPPQAINRWTHILKKCTDLPHVNPHALRHTFITLQLTAGVDIRTLQARSGHANASTLLNVYSHVIKSAQDKAAQIMDSVLMPVDTPLLIEADLNNS